MSKAKNPKYTSPRGVLSFPYLNKPDTKYVEEGVFKADLVVDAEEAKPLMKQLEDQLDDFIKEMEKETGKRQNRKKYRLPFEDHEEDDSKIVFKVKQNAVVKGSPVKLLYYDASRKKVLEPPLIRGGTVAKIAGTSRPYNTGANRGITLSISAVQMIELSDTDESSVDGANFGFEEEDGYKAEEVPFTEEPSGFDDDEEFEDENGDF